MSFKSNHLIDQIIEGRKTASVEWLDKQVKLDEWDSALKTDQVYTVCDSNRIPKCKIRVVEMELCRWDSIPERLWKGETNANADEFRADHDEYFDDPKKDFGFFSLLF